MRCAITIRSRFVILTTMLCLSGSGERRLVRIGRIQIQAHFLTEGGGHDGMSMMKTTSNMYVKSIELSSSSWWAKPTSHEYFLLLL